MRNDEIRSGAAEPAEQAPVTAPNDEPELGQTGTHGWLEAFRIALDGARRQQKVAEKRKELSRDKSKSFLALAAFAMILLVLFFGIFSSPRQRKALPGENNRGQAALGRKANPGRDAGGNKSVTPQFSANVQSTDPANAGQVTPEDVGRTSRTGYAASPAGVQPRKPDAGPPQDHTLREVDFSDPLAGRDNMAPPPPLSMEEEARHDGRDLRKPSLVFIRSTEAKTAIMPRAAQEPEETLALPAGTRLLARLEAPISSAVEAPAVAVVEYNYERDGQIVVPAGTKVFGRLTQAHPSGYVGVEFRSMELPDGSSAKMEASAMGLDFKPLKGYVSGKKTGLRFLVRSLTGLGTVASYLVGPQGSTSTGLISTNTLLRERLADNMSTAGQEELNGLALNANVAVTLPGNTRFYLVLEKPTGDSGDSPVRTGSPLTHVTDLPGRVPTLEELRELLQLRREINELYTRNGELP